MKDEDSVVYIEELLESRRFNEAKPLLIEQLKKNKNLPSVYNGLAIIALEKDQNAHQAEKYYHLALELEKNSEILHFNLGFLYEEFLNDLNKAKYHYEQAILIKPDYIDALTNSVELMLELEEEDDLIVEYCKKISEIDPENPRNLNNLGYLMMKKEKNYEEAIKYFEKAILFASDPAIILGNLADAYAKNQCFEEALQTYKKALTIDPNNALLCFNYAALLWQQVKDYDEAIIYYKKFITLEPENIFAYRALRSIYGYELEDSKSAVESLEKALIYFKNDSELLLEIANIYEYELRDYKKAKKYYLRILEINPNQIEALSALGFLSAEIFEEYNQGIDYYMKILELTPKAVEPYMNLAHLYFYNLKKYIKAQEYYEKAKKLIKNDKKSFDLISEIYYNLGMIYEQIHNEKEIAIYYYEYLVEKNNDEQAKRKLISLYQKNPVIH